jgi:hypothetical protein
VGNQIKLFPEDNVAVSAEIDLETACKIANTKLPLVLWGISTYAQNQLIFGSAPSKLPFFIIALVILSQVCYSQGCERCKENSKK